MLKIFKIIIYLPRFNFIIWETKYTDLYEIFVVYTIQQYNENLHGEVSLNGFEWDVFILGVKLIGVIQRKYLAKYRKMELF